MTILLTAGFLALLGATLEAQTGYFPLEVGNRWIYNGKWVPWNQEEDPVEERGTYELAITDTVRIASDFRRGMWTAERPPSASEGMLYSLLEGKRILRLVGLRPSSHDEASGEPHGLFFDAMLVREAGTLDGVYDDEERVPAWVARVIHGLYRDPVLAGDLIVAGGVREGRDGRWLLFEKDVPYWDLSAESRRRFSVAALEVGEGVEIWYDFGSEPREGSLVAGVTVGGRQYIDKDEVFRELSHLHSPTLVFQEGIGITRVTVSGMLGRSFLDLVDFTRGSDRTHVRPVSWGRLKKEMWER